VAREEKVDKTQKKMSRGYEVNQQRPANKKIKTTGGKGNQQGGGGEKQPTQR